MKFSEQLHLIAIDEDTGEALTSPRGQAGAMSPLGLRWRGRVGVRGLGAAVTGLLGVYALWAVVLGDGAGTSGEGASLSQQDGWFMQERDTYIQVLLNRTGSAGVCPPVPAPVLGALEQYADTARFIPCQRVFYNRVPKCGSRTVLAVMKELSRRYNYSMIGATKPTTGLNYYRSFSNLVSFVSNFSHLTGPVVYSQHLHFVNFSRFGVNEPLYINVVRDPVDRLISHYYYKKYGSNNAPKDATPKLNMSLDACVARGLRACLGINTLLPFFCGHERKCKSKTMDGNMLQAAKRTLRSAYLVVGITEDLPAFMDLLHVLLPQFFFNATSVFREYDEKLHLFYKTYKKPTVSSETIETLKDHLSMEYEFYEYAQQRFYTLYNKVKSLQRNNLSQQRRKERQDFLTWWEQTA